MAVPNRIIDDVAREVLDLLDEPREVSPFSSRWSDYGLEDAYRVVEAVRARREDRGERVVGRKIGFTNATAWKGYGITGPIWNYLYDRTTHDLASVRSCAVGRTPNLRMETEIAFGLSAPPTAAMDATDLLRCVDWVALDFEVCSSVFPAWSFQVADAATTGVHVALYLGPRHHIAGSHELWLQRLATFSAWLGGHHGPHAQGSGAEVLGSPVEALRRLVHEIMRFEGPPLVAGDIVTTGTLTQALPAQSGQTWRAETDIDLLGPIDLRLV